MISTFYQPVCHEKPPANIVRNKRFAKFWKIFITTLLASSSEDKVKMR